MSRISVKPQSPVIDKAVVRLQALIDELKREIRTLQSRVTKLESV